MILKTKDTSTVHDRKLYWLLRDFMCGMTWDAWLGSVDRSLVRIQLKKGPHNYAFPPRTYSLSLSKVELCQIFSRLIILNSALDSRWNHVSRSFLALGIFLQRPITELDTWLNCRKKSLTVGKLAPNCHLPHPNKVDGARQRKKRRKPELVHLFAQCHTFYMRERVRPKTNPRRNKATNNLHSCWWRCAESVCHFSCRRPAKTRGTRNVHKKSRSCKLDTSHSAKWIVYSQGVSAGTEKLFELCSSE